MTVEVVYTYKKTLSANYETITITLPNDGKHSIGKPFQLLTPQPTHATS